MTSTPKTIQIFLPTGDPQGIRVAEITTRIVRVIETPRSLLNDFLQTPESEQVAVYFLVGEEEGDEPRVYIGQTGDLKTRLRQHNKDEKKDFWERALVVVSLTNNLTQTHALFLEWYCLTAAREVGRYALENGNAGIRPHTPAPMEADCLEIYDTLKTLLGTLGYPVFTPLAKGGTGDPDDAGEVFYCTRSGCDGRGQYTSEGFIVLAGSRGRREEKSSIVDQAAGRSREALRAKGIVQDEGDQLVFQRDHSFPSPSLAAAVLVGSAANGWTEWKDAAGRTLDERKRQGE